MKKLKTRKIKIPYVVVGFIGSPSMNFIKSDIENGQFVANGYLINNIKKDPMKDVILGIRSEDMEIVNQGPSHIESMIYSIELTGEQTIVTSKWVQILSPSGKIRIMKVISTYLLILN